MLRIAGRRSSAFPNLLSSKLQIEKNSKRSELKDLESLKFGRTFTDHMFFVEHSLNSGWTVPEIKPFQNLQIHPASAGLHYAVQAFEGSKAFKGKDGKIRTFGLSQNVERFAKSLSRLCLVELDEKDKLEFERCLEKLIILDKHLVPQEPGYSLYIRPFAFGSEPCIGVSRVSKTSICCITCPVGPYYPRGFVPVRLLAMTQYARAWPGSAGSHKIGANYGPTLLPAFEAQKLGYDQLLWLYNEDGESYITEVGTMNFFFVKKESDGISLITPSLDALILPGITRAVVLELGREMVQKGELLRCEERRISMSELIKAFKEKTIVECFGSGTAAIISPISEITFNKKTMSISSEGEFAMKFTHLIQNQQYGDTESVWTKVLN